MSKKIFVLFFVGIFLILSMNFVLGWANVSNLVINGNVTKDYDEGVFTINWTPAGDDAAGNFSVYIWMNGVMVSGTENANVSATNYTWSNTTEASYNFTIEAVNHTGFRANSSNISMYVDSTTPTVNVTGYTNATAKKNTHTLAINVSVADALSGLTGSWCTFDVNGTNQTVIVASGWCNTTSLSLSGLNDGNQTIDVYVNDTVNNVGTNLSFFVVMVDTTVPANTFSCTPTTVWQDQVVTCSCSATDATSGVASTTYTVNPSTATAGTITTRCISLDNAGNWDNSTFTYDVNWKQQGIQGSKVSSPWTSTKVIDDAQFSEGYTKSLGIDSRVRFQVANINHHVGVKAVTTDSATIEIASDPVQVILNVGEEAKVDVTGDGFYDVYVILNSISGGLADVTIRSIYEEITEEGGAVSTTGEVQNQTEEEIPGTETPAKKMKWWWIWIIVGVVVIVLVYLIFVRKKK